MLISLSLNLMLRVKLYYLIFFNDKHVNNRKNRYFLHQVKIKFKSLFLMDYIIINN